jgi:hypothetical protein
MYCLELDLRGSLDTKYTQSLLLLVQIRTSQKTSYCDYCTVMSQLNYTTVTDYQFQKINLNACFHINVNNNDLTLLFIIYLFSAYLTTLSVFHTI